ncbi:MAG: hypothetical protein CM15mP47_3820 [Methanobacteriota archaeon]|nr:MAG: hypothetical protein CM15mP47_3820 [Euryarchaeota archaeon]
MQKWPKTDKNSVGPIADTKAYAQVKSKADPLAGSTQAKGIVVEKVGIEVSSLTLESERQ